MAKAGSVWGAPGWVLKELFQLYSNDPLTHFYLAYDILYKPQQTDVTVVVSGGSVRGYVLIYEASPGTVYAYAWNAPAETIVEAVAGVAAERVVVQLAGTSVKEAGRAASLLASRGFMVEEKAYIDMAVVDPAAFKPHCTPGARVVRLTERNAEDYVELEATRGVRISRWEAARKLGEMECYGAYIGGTLASIACIYLKLARVWAIGNVYTRPEHRGRGLAKAVTGAVTGRALACNATPVLHVEEDNEPAIRAYTAIGYTRLQTRPWLYLHAKSGSVR